MFWLVAKVGNVVVGVDIDVGRQCYTVGLVVPDAMVSFSETLDREKIPKALEQLGFNDVDDLAVKYFMEDLNLTVIGGKGLDLAMLEVPRWYNKSVVELLVQLKDLKWVFTLTKGPEMTFRYLRAQNDTIATLAVKVLDLKTMIQAKDDYLKYCKDHGFDNLTVFKRKKAIDFKLESFEDRKVEGVRELGEIVKEININGLGEGDGSSGSRGESGMGSGSSESGKDTVTTTIAPSVKEETVSTSPRKRKKPQGIIKKR